MSTETDIAAIKEAVKNIKEDTQEIKDSLFGNGHKGLKTRVIVLKVYPSEKRGKVLDYPCHVDTDFSMGREGSDEMIKYNLKGLSLREKQSVFVLMVSDLIHFAYTAGYELTFGDAWATKGHKPNSNHYIRLAIDLNLFKDGRYLTKTEDHAPLGEYWKSLGGSWGGKYSDGNHYSVEHEGRT